MFMGIAEIAGLMLSRSQQRVEIMAQNMANMTTPGFKSYRQFSDFMPSDETSSTESSPRMTADFTAGKLINTGNAFDLAVSGSGFFVVRSDSGTFYTRNGQFNRNADGDLVTPGGMILQSNTGDVTVSGPDVKILSDGTVMDGGQPVAKLAIADVKDPQTLQPIGADLFSTSGDAVTDVASPIIRQGMLEASNVSAADEMVSMMSALRSAESGQHLIQLYDDLMGRVLTTFGQS